MTTYFQSTGTYAHKRETVSRVLFILIFIVSLLGVQPTPAAQAAGDTAFFAVITDYGTVDTAEAQVATMVDSWNPDFIVTAGDNWQGSAMGSAGSTNSYENAVGNYYGDGGVSNGRVQRSYLNGDFYPVKGNHDYLAGNGRFEQYFSGLNPPIPFVEHSGTASYYQFVRGPVHFFMLDSGPYPGTAPNPDTQKEWLQQALAASNSPWKIVMFHKPAYTGGMHGNASDMQWPFAEWGADFVIAGHVHIYERIHRDGIRYFTAGCSASDVRSGTFVGEAYYSGCGAMRVAATETSITFEYVPLSTEEPVDTYTQERSAPTDPTITVSPASLAAFSSQPGVPSAAQSYTVSGVNLTGAVTITPPAGFEISQSASSGFTSTPISLNPSGGTLAATTIYVRLNRAEAGASSGNITHDSAGAATRNVAVTGAAAASGSGWVAYNDVVWATGQINTNITTYSIPGSSTGSSSGKLVDYATGTELPVSVNITRSGSPTVQTGSPYGGSESNSGTDAYDTFHGKVDMAGVVQYGSSSGWYVDITFTGLSPTQTYTFATTGNRNDSSYSNRIARFTISGVDAAVNASTPGVTVNSNESVSFSTGYNTTTGYVARWSGINPGADGEFTVRVQPDGSEYRAYGPSVFMLQAEGETITHTLTVSDDGNGSVNLNPPGGVYISGMTVDLTPAPKAGYVFSHWSGPNAGDVIATDAGYSIVMNEDKSITANFMAAVCHDVSLVAVADTYLRSSQPTENHGTDTEVRMSPFSTYPQNALFRWDLSAIPAGSVVSAASLNFYVTEGSDYPFNLFSLRRAWVEDSSNWNTYDGTNSWGAGGAQSTTLDRYDTNLWSATTSTFGSTGSQTIPLNANGVTVVQGWIDNPMTNFGFIIQAAQTASTNDYYIVASSEVANEAQRPRLNLTYCQAAMDPVIHISAATLPAFASQPGVPSAVQSYTVSAANLSDPLVISAPADFEISLSQNSGFGSTLNLTPSSGTVSSTTIYVRFNRASEGNSSGVINHTSPGAVTKTVTVNGAAAITPPWTAYNDVSGTSAPANTTEHSLDTVNGMLLDFDSGEETGVTVTMVTSSTLYNLSSEGRMPNPGTDAYETFNGRADMTGAIMSATTNPIDFTMDLVFRGLDPNKTYTFATSVNRAGGTGGDPAYTNRYTRYTIMDAAEATNASTPGVGVINEHSVYFCTGENTTNGYVARWINIRPNADGSFTVRAQPHDPQIPRVYAFGVFMLQEEASSGKTITVTATPGQSKVYGESDPAFSYTVSDPSVTLTGALEREPGETVGTYAILQGSLSAPAGYSINFISADFEITRRPASVKPADASKVYGNTDPVLSGTLTGFLPDDGVTAAYTREPGESVGTYIISATLSPSDVLDNYDIMYDTAEFAITPRPASVRPNDASKVYGEDDPVFSGTLTGFLPDDGVTATYTRTSGETVADGPYIISATLGPSDVLGNYDITYETADFTITPRPASVKPADASKVYGDDEPAFSGELTGFLDEDEVTAIYEREPGEDVGTYTISATLSPAQVLGNYEITYEPADFTISTRPITVTADNKSKVIGEDDPDLTYTITEGNLAFTDKFEGALERDPGEAIGTYAIKQGSLRLNNNYDLNFVPGVFTIGSKQVTVTVDTGQSKVYGENDPTFTYSVSDPSVALTGELSRVEGEAVGRYAITQGTLYAGEEYAIEFIPAEFEITPRPASVQPANASKVYGNADPVLSGVLTGFLDEDEVIAAYTRESGENVGTYTISATLSQSDVLDNYEITYETADFTITPRPASVRPNAASKIAGQEDPELSGVLTGFLPDDGVTATFTRAPGEDPGTYTITATLNPVSVLSNYNITYYTAEFTIKSAVYKIMLPFVSR